MEENVLKDFETFEEFPEKYLKITKNSDYYLLNNNGTSFIVKSKLKLVTIIDDKFSITEAYYNVINGDEVLNYTQIKGFDESNETFLALDNDIKIVSLGDVFNIKEKGIYYLGLEDLRPIVGFKEENSKTYNLKPKKNYF